MINGHESLEHLFCPKTVAEDPQAHCSAVMSANEAPFVVVFFFVVLFFWQQGGKFRRYMLPLPVQTVFLLNKYNNVTAYKSLVPPCLQVAEM